MVYQSPSKPEVIDCNSNMPNEPPIESTDVFITSWLSGGSSTPRTLRYNEMSFENSPTGSSFIIDATVSKSFDEETTTPPASSIGSPSQPSATFQNHEKIFEFNNYRDRCNLSAAAIPSSESFDSNDSHPNQTNNVDAVTAVLSTSKKNHRRESSISSNFNDRILSTQGRFSFTGSPIREHDEAFFAHHSSPFLPKERKEEDLIHRYTSKVRRLCLEDRPHQQFSQQETHRDFDKLQLSRLHGSFLNVDTHKAINPDFNADISPKDIFAFPEDYEMAHPGEVPYSPPTTPFDNITPIMTKKELKISPLPLTHQRSYHPSSPTTPPNVRKAKSRNMYEYEVDRLSPYAHSDRTTIGIDQHANKTSESRFNQDFEIVGTLGNGSYGTVYKSVSRLDGCTYAVKAAKKIAKGAADLDRMLREVRSLAALSDLTDPAAFHIVRYHQAWLEDRRLFIQTELCTSTLHDEIKMKGLITHDTQRRYKLLREMCLALDLIHRKEMVHLDLKPENIFVKNDQYKLGDFGLVNKTSIRGEIDEEGDSRYMAKDLLSGNHLDLTKCDIFSLGVTIYEVCSGDELPSDGQGWHDLRSGLVPALPHTPLELYGIIKDMMNSEPVLRPAASSLLLRRQLLSEEQKKLILEQNKVREATLALKHQEARYLQSPPKKTLMRSHTWNGVR